MAKDGAKMVQDGPRWSRWSQHGAKMEPRWSQDEDKMPQDGAKIAQDGRRWSQDGPGRSQDPLPHTFSSSPIYKKKPNSRSTAPAAPY